MLHLFFSSFRTTVCLQYPSLQIAVAAIFLATIQLNVKPLNPSKFRNSEEHSWFELLEADIDEEVLKKELHLYRQINIYIIKNITTYSSTLPHQYQLLIIQTKNVPQNYEIYLDLMVLHSIELLLKRLQQQLFVMMDIEGKELFEN